MLSPQLFIQLFITLLRGITYKYTQESGAIPRLWLLVRMGKKSSASDNDDVKFGIFTDDLTRFM